MEESERVITNDSAGQDNTVSVKNVEMKSNEELSNTITNLDADEHQRDEVDANGAVNGESEDMMVENTDSSLFSRSNEDVVTTIDKIPNVSPQIESHTPALKSPIKSENEPIPNQHETLNKLEQSSVYNSQADVVDSVGSDDEMRLQLENEPNVEESDALLKDSNNDDQQADNVNEDVDMAFGDEKSVNGTPDDIDVNVITEDKTLDKITNVNQEHFIADTGKDANTSQTNIKRQFHTIVLPSYSSWFDIDKIHSIEKESLPEFFQNVNKNKTPEIYIRYRNFMVNSYRLNPNDYLSFTAVRRNLIGDAGALLRVHKFLNKWGLINYQVNPETRPEPVEPPYTGDFVVDLDTPRGMFPFESYKPPTSLPNLEKVKDILRPVTTTTSPADELNGEPPQKKRKILQADINAGWDESSLHRLIEGISKFKNDWYKIAEYVGNNKTPNECIIRFLQLPIEDKFLEDNKEVLGPLKYVPNLSFSPKSNPILSTLAFLVNMVDSDVAAAASQRAIKVLDKKLEKKLNRFKVTEDDQNCNDDPLKDIKDAATNAFGIIGAKSHLFATYEEIEMHKALVNIVQHQTKIVDLKLAKCSSLEKEFELQRKFLEKKSSELLEQKLSIFKYNNAATSKLLQAIQLLESDQGLKDLDVTAIKNLIKQSKDILYKPPRKQSNKLEESDLNESEHTNESVKPISLEAPMLYRYWSG